jgi:thiamine-phosphate pyrophosphorylase
MLRYAITDRSQLGAKLGADESARRAALLACAARWAAEGVDFIQLREKDLPDAELLGLSRDLLAVIRASRPEATAATAKTATTTAATTTRLLLHSRADLALAAGLDGVHLPSASLDPASQTLTLAQARRLLWEPGLPEPIHPILSVSCHNLGEVRAALAGGADLILFGPVFGKAIPMVTAPEDPAPTYRMVTPALGLEALGTACAAAGSTPVLALGGVTSANIAACLEAGARGIAGIRLFQQPPATTTVLL